MIAGRGPHPSLVSLLIARLPDTSLTAALHAGSRDHFGWGMDRYLAADTYDAINQGTRASGNWGKKAPTFDPYPRPSVEKKGRKKKGEKVTVASLWKKFAR